MLRNIFILFWNINIILIICLNFELIYTNEIDLKNKVVISFPCNKDEDCWNSNHFNNESVKCTNGNCACLDTVNLTNSSSCFLTNVQKSLDGSCENDLNCLPANSYCFNDQCTCKPNYVPSNKHEKCMKVANSLNDTCEINIQCSTNLSLSTCFQNKCICKLYSFEHNGQCYTKSGLYKSCEIDENCYHLGDAFCSKKSICICNKNTSVDSIDMKRCLKLAASFSDSCEQNNQCELILGEYSICLNSVCTCPNRMQNEIGIKKKCRHLSALGDVCSVNTDCHQFMVSNESTVECTFGKCSCINSYVEFNGKCILLQDNGHKNIELDLILKLTLISNLILFIIH